MDNLVFNYIRICLLHNFNDPIPSREDFVILECNRLVKVT